jgi:hypothetical protein
VPRLAQSRSTSCQTARLILVLTEAADCHLCLVVSTAV